MAKNVHMRQPSVEASAHKNSAALHRGWRWPTGLIAIGVPIAALLALGFQFIVAIFWGFMVGLAFETLRGSTDRRWWRRLRTSGTTLAKDQLGNPRTQDGDNDGEAVCDIGAFEWQSASE